MSVNQKISGDLTVDGSIIGGGIVPTITAQNYLPVLRLNPDPTLESSGFFYFDSNSNNRLYHQAFIPITGLIETNFILDSISSVIQIGNNPSGSGAQFPMVGFYADNYAIAINGASASPYAPIFEYQYGTLLLREGSGSGTIQMYSGGISIQQYVGALSLFGMGGINIDSPSGAVFINGLSLNIGTNEIQLANSNLIDNGTHAPSGNYLKMYDQMSGNTYYLPLYT